MKSKTADTETANAKLKLAQEFFKQHYAACFWHLDPHMVVTAATLPLVIKGLELHGGHRGLQAAAQLRN